MPVYNGAGTLRRALDALLDQDFRDLELLVSDNASQDATQEICEEFARRDPRFRYLRHERNQGAVRNFNLLVEEARGDLFMWHAADDRSLPGLLRTCVAGLDDHPEAVLAYVQAECVDDEGRIVPRPGRALPLDSPEVETRFAACLDPMTYSENVIYGLVRRRAMLASRRHGDFGGGDRALCAELALMGPFVRIDRVLFQRGVPSEAMNEVAVQRYNTGRREAASLREWLVLRHNVVSVARARLPWATKARLGAVLLRRLGMRENPYLSELKGWVRATLGI